MQVIGTYTVPFQCVRQSYKVGAWSILEYRANFKFGETEQDKVSLSFHIDGDNLEPKPLSISIQVNKLWKDKRLGFQFATKDPSARCFEAHPCDYSDKSKYEFSIERDRIWQRVHG